MKGFDDEFRAAKLGKDAIAPDLTGLDNALLRAVEKSVMLETLGVALSKQLAYRQIN